MSALSDPPAIILGGGVTAMPASRSGVTDSGAGQHSLTAW